MSRVNSAHAIMASRHKNRSLPPQVPLFHHHDVARAQAPHLTTRSGCPPQHRYEVMQPLLLQLFELSVEISVLAAQLKGEGLTG